MHGYTPAVAYVPGGDVDHYEEPLVREVHTLAIAILGFVQRMVRENVLPPATTQQHRDLTGVMPQYAETMAAYERFNSEYAVVMKYLCLQCVPGSF